MKKNVLSALLIGLAMYSCQQEDYVTAPQHETELKSSKLQEVATLLTEIPLDEALCAEVNTAAAAALGYGLDENYLFREVFGSQENKITTRSGRSSILAERLKDLAQNKNQLRSTDANETDGLVTELGNSNIQIYWPYSDDWDGVTMPVITFAPEDKTKESNIGYKQVIQNDGSIKIETIIIDEEYAENNPVWVINYNETAYDEYPAFAKGETVNKNIAYNTANVDITNTRAVGDPVYTVNLGKFMSSKNYDSWFDGGSEFEIQMGALDVFTIASASDLSINNVKVTSVRVNRSRKDIKKKRWATMNSVLTSNWLKEENNAGFMIHERDQGGTKNWETDLSVKWAGKDYSFKAKIPYGSGDDIIYRTTYSRNFIFSTNNKTGSDWREHTSGGVNWTLPYQIGRVEY